MIHNHSEVILHTKDFLLEIGTEEIPAGYLTDAINYINNSFSEFLQENRLESKKQQTTFTPRRLVLLVTDLQTQQTDIEIIKNGPSRKIALSENGMPSKALDGFLRSNNASIGDVYWQDTGKGEVAHLKIKQIGVPTNELLKNWLSALIAGIPFPKKMKWGSGNLEFARPIRWLICLWGDDVLPCSIDGISADRISYGNRFLDLESRVSVINTQHYCSALKEIFVLTDRQERYDNIKKQLSDIFADGQHQVDIDEGLLQTVTDLVEYPTAVIAEFEEKYLVLPEMIVTSTISQNQKYFAVKDQSGKLTNKFVFISNGNPEYGELIRKGNEKVVKPRLEDAMWYFQEDTKHKLEEYVPKLQEVVFHKELGSVKDKTDRIIKVSEYLCKQLNLSDKDTSQTHRTALLCKADLVTKMLGEKEF
ncbi:MAG: glycine--tRNA ligase subunit beta, partial [Candidatus Cloacimonetes bacterium]|nr:glycine--tRNA ligase subunit beta [Candidatus Cloacimonadota bacterium]